jgi:lysophospholipase L1-like esterase
MRDRHFRSATHCFKFSLPLLRLKLLPSWVFISLATNAVLLITLLFSLLRQSAPTANASSDMASENAASPSALKQTTPQQPPKLGDRHQLTYEEWLDQLKREADNVADQQPERLTILAGDSISLWFPSGLLPTERTWLNQGISGETSSGLLRRLDLFEQTRPDTIFVMIGINDLLRGDTSDQTILANQRLIIQELDKNHSEAKIVLQSILPHAKESNWEGRERLLSVSNQRIKELNQQLEQMARQEGVYFLDLYPLFANPDGDLRPELSTDGLHLNSLGYQTWSIALQVYSREVLDLDGEE